jgi:hypothetical protein
MEYISINMTGNPLIEAGEGIVFRRYEGEMPPPLPMFSVKKQIVPFGRFRTRPLFVDEVPESEQGTRVYYIKTDDGEIARRPGDWCGY